MSMLFCNPLADVESNKTSSAYIIVLITLPFICLGSADCSFNYVCMFIYVFAFVNMLPRSAVFPVILFLQTPHGIN